MAPKAPLAHTWLDSLVFAPGAAHGIEKKNGEDEETLTCLSELQAMFKNFLDSGSGTNI